RAVRLDGDLEAACMQRVDQRRIKLEQRLAAGADDEAAFRGLRFPGALDGVRESIGTPEFAAVRPVRADEIRVAKGADGAGAVLLAAGPQIAPGEAAENRGPARIRAFALQRVEDFLDRIHEF